MLSRLVLLALAIASSAAPNPMITAAPIIARADMPRHCTTVYKNPLLESTWMEPHKCYTHTETVIQPRCRCRQASDIMCLQYIEETTTNIPCKTDCCPTTATVTQEICPDCNPRQCTISTVTNMRYTGCPAPDMSPPTGMPTVVVTPGPTPVDPLEEGGRGDDDRIFPPYMGPYIGE